VLTLTQRNFYIEAGGASIGDAGYLDVTVAGLTVNYAVGLITEGHWSLGGSGIMGLAYPAATQLFMGTNVTADNWFVSGTAPGNQVEYPSLLPTMIEQDIIAAPLFSLALQRAAGGYIAFGGLPPVDFEPDFVTVPIEKVRLGAGTTSDL